MTDSLNASPEALPWHRRPEYLALLLVGVVYVALIGRYRAYDLDDPWFLSFSHGYWVHGVQTDTFMRMAFPSGMGGVVAFGKLAAFVQGAILSVTGWTLAAGTLISVVFVFAALWLLIRACERFGYSSHFTACYVLLVGLTEPFVFASQKTRYEFLPLFLLALALWLVSRQSVLPAMFVGALAAEVEPTGVVVGCAIFVVIVVQNRKRGLPLGKTLLRVAIGAVAALAIYLLLHSDIVATLHAANWKAASAGRFPGGFVTLYYLKYKRHLPELLVLLVAVAASFARARRGLFVDWPFLCVVTVAVISALLGWGNVPYFCFISPFVCLFLLQVFFSEKNWKWVAAAALLYTLPAYAYRFYYWDVRHPGFTESDERELAAAIVRAAALSGKTSAQASVVGSFEAWYAHPDHFANLDKRTATDSLLGSADVIVCPEKALDPVLAPKDVDEVTCSTVRRIPSRVVEALNVRGHEMEIVVPEHER
jgi:hypothetical protein